MKLLKRFSIGCLPFFFTFFLLFLVICIASQSTMLRLSVKNKNLSQDVLNYQPLMEKYASENEISEYVPYLLAIMEVESGGKGTDPMQASESIDVRIGNIMNVEDSIRQGVKHFKNQVDSMKSNRTDVWSAVQSYNYGGEFFRLVKNENWSFEKAEQFSKEMANGVKVAYVNDISISKGYNWRYNYGNMFYVLLVQQYITSDVTSIDKSELGQPLEKMADVMITSPFGQIRSVHLQNGHVHSDVHDGVDLVYKDGRTNAPVFSVSSGEVVFAQSDSAGGLGVIVKHAEDFYSYYWHLSNIDVAKGQVIDVGTRVGSMGSTGLSSGVHLHLGFSRKLWSEHFDPKQYLNLSE